MVTLHSTLRYTLTDQVAIFLKMLKSLQQSDGIFITNLSLETHWLEVYRFIRVFTINQMILKKIHKNTQCDHKKMDCNINIFESNL